MRVSSCTYNCTGLSVAVKCHFFALKLKIFVADTNTKAHFLPVSSRGTAKSGLLH
ncbi:MAG: hypothetical protein AVDCRST_MAG56-8055 [uncultured Cytophagales bacterium]|uniref:Uncharacterized protein n=1 Tax=uncultured Cytophagales bacterium TaxID=158755 RepID=A0A6J4LWL9_9SPHI|nr:MAG: hypothetical protein AVDCRST_MAG56-8055 [uncultured Cytophagales bacterium]